MAIILTGITIAGGTSMSYIPPSTGEALYTTPGSFSFVVPVGVTSISAVLVGGGGGAFYGDGSGSYFYGGAGGGGLRYINSLTVTPGETITVNVGANGGSLPTSGPNYAGRTLTAGGTSSLLRSANILVQATGGQIPTGGPDGNSFVGWIGGAAGSGTTVGAGPYGGTIGGGNGGKGGDIRNTNGNQAYTAGGGGAGGYSGDGGYGGGLVIATGATVVPINGAGGGGAGGYYGVGGGGAGDAAGGGGGVGLFGIGSNGAVGSTGSSARQGGGGSGGASGQSNALNLYGNGGNYGAGGGSNNLTGVLNANAFYFHTYAIGGKGAVRIIWGPGRSFPSNAT